MDTDGHVFDGTLLFLGLLFFVVFVVLQGIHQPPLLKICNEITVRGTD